MKTEDVTMDAKTKIEKPERAIELINDGKDLISDAENLAEECEVDTGGVICDCDDAIAVCNDALDKIKCEVGDEN